MTDKYASILCLDGKLTLKCILFGLQEDNEHAKLLNHIILLAKKYIYECKLNRKHIIIPVFDIKLRCVMNIEKKVAYNSVKERSFLRKWSIIQNILIPFNTV